jgi:tRNA(Ile)-lysidine synthase
MHGGMLTSFLEYTSQNSLVKSTDKILLAVSGGIDSIAMCHLFHKSGFQFSLAHANFQLRGEAADGDEEFVHQLAKKWKVPFYSKRFETQKYAQEKGISIQMAARELRYQWFNELVERYGFNKVATAHHQQDALETVLLNLVRGTGIVGLAGIKPSSGVYIRPILFATKEQILAYVATNKLTWREDDSNQTSKYYRNYIRHEILPLLQKLNPSLLEHFNLTRTRLEGAAAIAEEYYQNWRSESLHESDGLYYIRKSNLNKSSKALTLFGYLLQEFGFSFATALQVANSLHTTGAIFRSDGFVLNVDRDFLILSKDQEEIIHSLYISNAGDEVNWNNSSIKTRIEVASGSPYSVGTDSAQLDMDRLVFPLEVRSWKEGDSFYPLGLIRKDGKPGKKKVSDLLVDLKIPLTLKKDVKVILSEGKIVWVVGLRIDERFKVKDTTRTTLVLEYLKND